MPKLIIKTEFHSKELDRIVKVGETVELNKTPKTSLDNGGIQYEVVKDKPVTTNTDGVKNNEKAEKEDIKNKAESKLKNK